MIESHLFFLYNFALYSYKSAKSKLLYNKIAKLIQFVGMGVILVLGLYLVNKNMMETSVLLIICMYNSYVFTFIDKLGLLASCCSSFSMSCNRIFSLLDYKKVCYGNIYNRKCLGKLEFDSVRFRYDDTLDDVLAGCSFKVDGNEFVGIIGKSGEGKTTILNLIALEQTPLVLYSIFETSHVLCKFFLKIITDFS